MTITIINNNNKALTLTSEQLDIMFSFNNKTEAINAGVDTTGLPNWSWQ